MKSLLRRIEKIIEPEPVIEGAGVRLTKSIATQFQLWVNLPAKLKMSLTYPSPRTPRSASRSNGDTRHLRMCSRARHN